LSKYDKLLEKIQHLDKDLRFDELAKVLEKIGYRMDAPDSGSSHRTFRKENSMPITIAKHKPIKVVYIKLVRDALVREGVL
jgi:predicted RNA binding protein YcfA (HicA-like mRNA interferase family)